MAYIVNETRTLTTYKTMSIIYASHACRNPETAIEFCFFRFLRPLFTSISNPAVRAGDDQFDRPALMENTQGSRRFAVLLCAEDSEYMTERYGGYLDVFVNLLGEKGEVWDGYKVSAGEFPSEEEVEGYDGFVVTGSCSDADGEEPWILRLVGLLRRLHCRRKKVLGVCFGHQVIPTHAFLPKRFCREVIVVRYALDLVGWVFRTFNWLISDALGAFNVTLFNGVVNVVSLKSTFSRAFDRRLYILLGGSR